MINGLSNLPVLANSGIGFAVTDLFDRPDGALGTVSDGTASWVNLQGSISIVSYKATSTSASAISYIANESPNVEISAGVSSGGGDALYFRILNVNNWTRVLVDTVGIPENVFNGTYDYSWKSALGTSDFFPPWKDPAKYYASQRSCASTSHIHNVPATTYPERERIIKFDVKNNNNKWGLYPFIAIKRGIRMGDEGEDVYYLQSALNKVAGESITVDGIFGLETDGAVRRFQKAQNIIVDGYAWNQQTWPALDDLAFQDIFSSFAGPPYQWEAASTYARNFFLQEDTIGLLRIPFSVLYTPDKTVIGTEERQPPPTAYTTVVHSHALILNGCRKLTDIGTHEHRVTNTYLGKSPSPGSTTTVITKSKYRLRLQQCVNGSVSNLTTTLFDYNNEDSEPITSLKVVAFQNYIEVYINEASSPCMATWSAPWNQVIETTYTNNGIGRGPSSLTGSGITTFKCLPLDAIIIPEQS